MLTMMAGILDTELIRRGMGKGGGGGSGCFTKGNQEGIWKRDLEGGRGGHRITWGRVMWWGIYKVLE